MSAYPLLRPGARGGQKLDKTLVLRHLTPSERRQSRETTTKLGGNRGIVCYRKDFKKGSALRWREGGKVVSGSGGKGLAERAGPKFGHSPSKERKRKGEKVARLGAPEDIEERDGGCTMQGR